jgi:hypothetical protein
VSTLLELHIIAMFVSEHIVNAEISMPGLRPVNSNLCLFRLVRTWRGDDFVDGSGHSCTWWFLVRAGSRFSSAILADLAMHGLPISVRTLARVALPGSFFAFFRMQA